MFNIILSSHQSRTGRSTSARLLSKLLQMPTTSGGDLLRLFALEYVNGLDRGTLINEFIEKHDLEKIIRRHGNVSSEDFVNFHNNEVSKDQTYDLDIDKYLLQTFLKGGWIVDSVTAVPMIANLTNKQTKLYENFIESEEFTEENAKEIRDNSVLVYFTADPEIRAQRSAFYEEVYGYKTNAEKEKKRLQAREESNKERYLEIYGFDITEGANHADMCFDSSKMTPIEICTGIIQKSDKISARLKELGIIDFQSELEKIAEVK